MLGLLEELLRAHDGVAPGRRLMCGGEEVPYLGKYGPSYAPARRRKALVPRWERAAGAPARRGAAQAARITPAVGDGHRYAHRDAAEAHAARVVRAREELLAAAEAAHAEVRGIPATATPEVRMLRPKKIPWGAAPLVARECCTHGRASAARAVGERGGMTRRARRAAQEVARSPQKLLATRAHAIQLWLREVPAALPAG